MLARRRSISSSRTRTSSSRTCTTCSWAARSSRCSPGSLLVPEDDRPAALRAAREGPLLAVGRSASSMTFLPQSTSWARRHATAVRRLRGGRRLDRAELPWRPSARCHRGSGRCCSCGGRRGAATAAGHDRDPWGANSLEWAALSPPPHHNFRRRCRRSGRSGRCSTRASPGAPTDGRPMTRPVRRVRRLLLADHPQETRFFAFLASSGSCSRAIYWFATMSWPERCCSAGSRSRLGPSACGRRWTRARRSSSVRAKGRPRRRRRAAPLAGAVGPKDAARDPGPAGPDGRDRPFLDEAGRLPGETLAPLAVGLGVAHRRDGDRVRAVAAGRGMLPIRVGRLGVARRGARDELDAMEARRPGRARFRSPRRPSGDARAAGRKTVAEYPEIRKP